MRSLTHAGRTGSSHTASRHDAGHVSPASLLIAQEADATMTPDGWGADYSAPGFVTETPLASPVSSFSGAEQIVQAV
jgi:hypothetical protein